MRQYTEDDLLKALEAVTSGCSIKKAAHDKGIPRTTLQNRIRGHQTRGVAFAGLQRLSPTQESHLAEWIRIQAALGLPPTHQQLKDFAERILQTRRDFQPLGRNWVQSFIKRNPSIKVQRSRAIDSQRVNGASTNVIREWFKHLALPEIQAIKASNRYNMDETGILEGRGSNGLVLGSSETRSIRKKQPGSRAWTSLIECISATGKALPPLVIYKGKTVQQQWFPLDLTEYDGWKFTATENGWTSDSTAVEWLQKVFIPLTQPQDPKESRLLILDGHGSHETTEFMYICFKNKILLLFLPPHTSHVLQPLDQSVFGPLKAIYKKELLYLDQWDASTVIGKRNFLLCYGKARHIAFTSKNIISGWKYTGLWPVSIAKPPMSPLLLGNPSTPARQTDQPYKGLSNAIAGEKWASETSAVCWSTPTKRSELQDQFNLYNKVGHDRNTQRLLFRKVQKGFDEQSYKLAVAQRKIEALEAEVEASRARKRKKVTTSPNSKFANIEAIRKAQIEAGEIEDSSDESSKSDLPTLEGNSIVVAID
ncbi:transposase [Colletotrichum truncatum]|nr:transposase [Colletotrichum truncatum]XP_036577337.1 transposase [Colletotrichum truncatum]KAF6782262.1 transposase [Colletotrichum truncatum]KAF6784277.1 transposase [Colletotrichum truncatum]